VGLSLSVYVIGRPVGEVKKAARSRNTSVPITT
jgi:hypothetical protein